MLGTEIYNVVNNWKYDVSCRKNSILQNVNCKGVIIFVY